jgi:hypothetical protein
LPRLLRTADLLPVVQDDALPMYVGALHAQAGTKVTRKEAEAAVGESREGQLPMKPDDLDARVRLLVRDIQRALKECEVEKAERLVREALVEARKEKRRA